MYAKIENGIVIEIGSCPKCTNITSNFYLLPEEEKNKQGWFKIEDEKPILEEWQKSEREIDIIEGKPFYRYNIIEQDFEKWKQNKINNLKTDMRPQYPDLYDQLNAALDISTEEDIAKVKSKILRLKEVYNIEKALIEKCKSFTSLKNKDIKDKVL